MRGIRLQTAARLPPVPGASIPTPVDFDLVPTGGASWELQIFVGGRGADKRMGYSSNPLILSAENDNIIQPVSILDRIDEQTRVIVAGAMEGKERDLIIVQNATAEAGSAWNVVEGYHDSRLIDNFGARFRLSSCEQGGLPSDQLKYRLNGKAGSLISASDSVRITFDNGSIVTSTVDSVIVHGGDESDQVIIDYGGTTVDCNYKSRSQAAHSVRSQHQRRAPRCLC